jgi:uncharacterized protein
MSALAQALVVAALALIPHAPTTFVTDGAGLLRPETRARLEQELGAFQQSTGHQVIVWIGQSTGGTPLEEWSAKTFEAWGVGRKGLDDGVALFILAGDRRARIEVGYGLEPVLTDLSAGRILDQDLIPGLKGGDPDAAVSKTVDAMLSTISPGAVDRSQNPSPEPVEISPLEVALGAVALVVFIALFIRYPAFRWFVISMLMLGRRGGRSGGGFSGGFSGGGGRSGGGGASRSW